MNIVLQVEQEKKLSIHMLLLCLDDEDGDYVVMFLLKNWDKGDSFMKQMNPQ